MIREGERELYEQALKKWGEEDQLFMFFEEVGELMKAVNKFRRKPNKDTFDNVCEELADVELVMNQIRIMVDESVIEKYRARKIERLKYLLNK